MYKPETAPTDAVIEHLPLRQTKNRNNVGTDGERQGGKREKNKNINKDRHSKKRESSPITSTSGLNYKFYSSDQTTCWLSSITLYTVAVCTVWSLLG
jgi:hypothetical protein